MYFEDSRIIAEYNLINIVSHTVPGLHMFIQLFFVSIYSAPLWLHSEMILYALQNFLISDSILSKKNFFR